MIWFVLAAAIGFVGARSLRSGNYALALGSVLALLAVGFIGIQTRLLPVLNEGEAFRLVLGLLFGAGAAIATTNAAGSKRIMLFDPDARTSTLAIGGALLLLAALAPHLDSWLRRTTGFKSALFEVQLSSNSSKQAYSISTGQNYVTDNERLLDIVAGYDKSLGRYAEYLKRFLIPYLERRGGTGVEDVRQRLNRVNALRPIFDKVISPAAACLQKAIFGGLSQDSARALVRPAAETVIRIVQYRRNEIIAGVDPRLTGLRNDLVTQIADVADASANNLDESGAMPCRNIRREAAADGSQLPEWPEYKSDPYLYVNAAAMVAFAGDRRLALALLLDAPPKVREIDFNLPFLIATFMNDDRIPVSSYYTALEGVRTLTRQQFVVLNDAAATCTHTVCTTIRDDLLKTTKYRRINAINILVYGFSMDWADEVESAAALQPIVSQYVSELEEAAADEALFKSHGPLYDTIGFYLLVQQVRSNDPDKAIVRDAVSKLKLSVALQEQRLKSIEDRNKLELTKAHNQLAIARAHLKSASLIQKNLEE